MTNDSVDRSGRNCIRIIFDFFDCTSSFTITLLNPANLYLKRDNHPIYKIHLHFLNINTQFIILINILLQQPLPLMRISVIQLKCYLKHHSYGLSYSTVCIPFYNYFVKIRYICLAEELFKSPTNQNSISYNFSFLSIIFHVIFFLITVNKSCYTCCFKSTFHTRIYPKHPPT